LKKSSHYFPNNIGTLLGLEHSLFAAARVFAPQAGVYLLQTGGVSAVSGGCAAVFLVVYVAWQTLSDDKHTVLSVGVEGKGNEVGEEEERKER
jgi:hypothetical protein